MDESVHLSRHEVLLLGKVLREHKFDERLFGFINDEDMNELQSRLENPSDLKAHIRMLQEKYGEPRRAMTSVRWWKRLASKKPKDGASEVESSPGEAEQNVDTVFLCGASQTGKSTLYKRLHEYYGAWISTHDRREDKPCIRSNVVLCMKAVLKKSTDPCFLAYLKGSS